jgi:hypothetical protein
MVTPEERSAAMSELGKLGARERRVKAVERRIRELVDNAPPLTDEQRRRLVVLLAPREVA